MTVAPGCVSVNPQNSVVTAAGVGGASTFVVGAARVATHCPTGGCKAVRRARSAHSVAKSPRHIVLAQLAMLNKLRVLWTLRLLCELVEMLCPSLRGLGPRRKANLAPFSWGIKTLPTSTEAH